jgi:hypothetical protein
MNPAISLDGLTASYRYQAPLCTALAILWPLGSMFWLLDEEIYEKRSIVVRVRR